MSQLAAIAASDLACIRGGRILFRDLSFAVGAGRLLCIEGANGAGKTSLLRVIAGFLAPAAGTLVVRRGEEEIAEGELRARFVGWLGHEDAAKPQLTAFEQLRFFARLYNGGEGDVAGALEQTGLARVATVPNQYLSAGQKKRLALARLTLSNRPLWLLDEPLASLDAAGKAIASTLIKAHCDKGGIAVAATHEPLGLDATRLMLGAA